MGQQVKGRLTPTFRVTVRNAKGSLFQPVVTTTANTTTVTGLTPHPRHSYFIKVTTAATLAGWTPSMTTKVVNFRARLRASTTEWVSTHRSSVSSLDTVVFGEDRTSNPQWLNG